MFDNVLNKPLQLLFRISLSYFKVNICSGKIFLRNLFPWFLRQKRRIKFPEMKKYVDFNE